MMKSYSTGTIWSIMRSWVPLAAALSSFLWPQELEKIKTKIASPQPGVPALSTFDINVLAEDGSDESVSLLFEVSDSPDDSSAMGAFRKLLDLHTGSWRFPDKAHESITAQKILEKWASSSSPFLRRTSCQMAVQWGLIDLLPEVQSLLYDPDYDVKLECTRALFDLYSGSKDLSGVVEKYPQLLSSGYQEIKDAVLKGLGDLKIKEAFPAVVTMISSDNPTTRSMALMAAASIDPEKAFPYVSSSLHDEAFQVRLTAVTALGQIRTEDSAARLSSLLASPSDASVRMAALAAVAESCLPQSIDILLKHLEDKSSAAIAAEGLKRCHEGGEGKIGSLLVKTGDGAVRSSLLQILSSGPTTPYLDALLVVRDKIEGLEPSYLQCLDGIPDRKALVAILSLTEHKSETVRLAALEHAHRYFKRYGYDDIAGDVIINSLTDGADSVRGEALAMAARWKIKEAAPLMKGLLKSSIEFEKTAAAVLLISLGEHAADDIVIGGLHSFDAGVRRSCAQTLLQFPPSCSGKILDSTVRSHAFFDRSSPGAFERFIAAGSILKSCSDPEGTAMLRTLVENSSGEEASLPALASIISSRQELLAAVGKLLSEGRNVHSARDLSTRLWLASGDAAGVLLNQLLASPDALTRSGAVLSLTRTAAVGDDEKTKRLLKMLEDSFAGTRVNAMAGLTSLTEEAGGLGDDICKKLDRPLGLPETVAALKLLSVAGGACLDEKLGRLVLSQNKTIRKSALKAAAKRFGGEKAGAMPDKLRFALATCARSDPDKENKQICWSLVKTGFTPAFTPSKLPPAMAFVGTLANIMTKLPGSKGGVTASAQILPFEYSISQLDTYPRYYPFYFIDSGVAVHFLFKNSLCFSGLNFDESESYVYLDALKK